MKSRSSRPSRTLDWRRLQSRIRADNPHGYWRSLGELAGGPDWSDRQRPEFPDGAELWPEGSDGGETTRRRFLQLMGASIALAGASGCQQPDEAIVPYVETPENQVPGNPLYFATAMPQHGFGHGLVVESHDGRPTKVDGNQLHPATRGAGNVLAQASVLTLYDPERSQIVLRDGNVRSQDSFRTFWSDVARRMQVNRGRGLRVLTGAVSSPTLLRQLESLRDAWPELKWHQYDPVLDGSEREGTERVFGQPFQPLYEFGKAGVVLALGGDFLDPVRSPACYARDFMERRKVVGREASRLDMNRLYVVESTPSLSGSKADHRLRVSPPDIGALAAVLAERLGVSLGGSAADLPPSIPADWVEALVGDLTGEGKNAPAGGALIVPGFDQPAEVHALAHAINSHLARQRAEAAVRYVPPVRVFPSNPLESLGQLTEDMAAGRVDTLLILDGNPVFTAPADLDFARALQQVPHAIHWGLYANETARLCQWHLPAQHYLESWSDVRAYEGTASIIQPLIAPLYDGICQHELLAMLGARTPTSADSSAGPYESPDFDQATDSYQIVQSTWREHFGDEDFSTQWQKALTAGVVPGTQANAVEVAYDGRAIELAGGVSGTGNASGAGGASNQEDAPRTVEESLHVVFRPDPTIDDGEFANNAWLQELPKPHTKLTWDNAALISPELAQRRNLRFGQMVRLEHQGRRLRLPVWIQPGQAENVVTLFFGYGGQPLGGEIGQG